ncbi:MAG TPA: ABC transporter permease, partial [Longimicrobiaceae bacterium]|nr:ABC transporter permease [Longimicrobiaceae bacterium]
MSAPHARRDGLPLPLAVMRTLLPSAERDEVLADLRAEAGTRRERDGRFAAGAWLWRQAAGSVPALLRRSWWRGWNGFEPQANRLQPGGPMLESWIMDVRFAARRLRIRPTYALLAVLTLALGVGGTAAVYSLVKALLLDPLPYRDEKSVAVFWNTFDWSEREFLMLRGRFDGFGQVAAYRTNDVTLEQGGGPARLLPGISSSAELFSVLGAAPLVGRGFQPGDDRPGAEPVAVISYGLWQELGGSRTIIGSRLSIGGAPRTVVGVMP